MVKLLLTLISYKLINSRLLRSMLLLGIVVGAVMRFFDRELNQISRPQIYLHDEGFFVIKFATQEDRNCILSEGPHSFNRRPMIIKS